MNWHILASGDTTATVVETDGILAMPVDQRNDHVMLTRRESYAHHDLLLAVFLVEYACRNTNRARTLRDSHSQVQVSTSHALQPFSTQRPLLHCQLHKVGLEYLVNA